MLPTTTSLETVLSPSDWLIDQAERAIVSSQAGGVYEPFLKDPHWANAGLSLLGCKDVVLPHRDSEELPPWSFHWVVTNSGFIVKRPFEDVSQLDIQETGKLVRFNVHNYHMLCHDYRASHVDQDPDWGASEIGFASVCFNLKHKYSMAAAFQQLQERMAILEDTLNIALRA